MDSGIDSGGVAEVRWKGIKCNFIVSLYLFRHFISVTDLESYPVFFDLHLSRKVLKEFVRDLRPRLPLPPGLWVPDSDWSFGVVTLRRRRAKVLLQE